MTQNSNKCKIRKYKRILISESNLTSSKILFNLFYRLEMEPFVVNTEVDALIILKKREHFDIILIDNTIAGTNNGIVSSELKNYSEYRNIPIVLISHPSIIITEQTVYQYFNSRITRPLKHSQLVSIVTNLLSKTKITQKQQIIEPRSSEKLNDKFPLHNLVAEDNAINQKMMLSLFEILGYSIQIAANGLEAIETIKRIKIDIVFMDNRCLRWMVWKPQNRL